MKRVLGTPYSIDSIEAWGTGRWKYSVHDAGSGRVLTVSVGTYESPSKAVEAGEKRAHTWTNQKRDQPVDDAPAGAGHSVEADRG